MRRGAVKKRIKTEKNKEHKSEKRRAFGSVFLIRIYALFLFGFEGDFLIFSDFSSLYIVRLFLLLDFGNGCESSGGERCEIYFQLIALFNLFFTGT